MVDSISDGARTQARKTARKTARKAVINRDHNRKNDLTGRKTKNNRIRRTSEKRTTYVRENQKEAVRE